MGKQTVKWLAIVVVGGGLIVLGMTIFGGKEQKRGVSISSSSIPPLANARVSTKNNTILYSTVNGIWRYNISNQEISAVWGGVKLPTISNLAWSHDESAVIFSAYDYSPSDTLGSVVKEEGLDINSRYWWVLDLKNKKPILLPKNTTSAVFDRSKSGVIYTTEYLGVNNQSNVTIYRTEHQKGIKKKLFSKPDVVGIDAAYGSDFILSFKDFSGLSVAKVNSYGEINRLYTGSALREGEVSPDGKFITISEGSYVDEGFEEINPGGKTKVYSVENGVVEFSVPIDDIMPEYDWVNDRGSHILFMRIKTAKGKYNLSEIDIDKSSETKLVLEGKKSWGDIQIINFLKGVSGPLLFSSPTNITEIHDGDKTQILRSEKQPSEIDYTTSDYSISYDSYASGFIINTTSSDPAGTARDAVDYINKNLGYKISLYNVSVVNRGDNYVGP